MFNNSLRKSFRFFKNSQLIKKLTRKINLEVDKTPEELQHDVLIKKEEKEHRNRLMHTLLLKKIKFLKLEEGLLQKQKIVVEPLRLRHKLDDLRFLHSKKEVACYLESRGDFEPVHFVVHQLQAKAIRRLKDLHTRPIYLKLGNEEIRCLIKEFSFSRHLHYYFRIVFKRYIPGEPNETKVKLFFDDMAHFHQMDKQIQFHHPSIDVISYNDVNPSAIKLDIYRLLRKQKYTFGDVQNILPPGLELHPKYSKMINAKVAVYDSYLSKKVQDIKWFDMKDERYYSQIKDGDDDLNSQFKDEFDQISGVQKIKKKDQKAPPKQKMGSLKKQLKAEQDKLRKLLEEEQRNIQFIFNLQKLIIIMPSTQEWHYIKRCACYQANTFICLQKFSDFHFVITSLSPFLSPGIFEQHVRDFCIQVIAYQQT